MTRPGSRSHQAAARVLAVCASLVAILGCADPLAGYRLWLEPEIATLLPGAELRFTAQATSGLDAADVTWFASGGDVSGNGSAATYTAPLTPGYYQVRATSNTARRESGWARVRVVVTDHAPACTDPEEGVDIPDVDLREQILRALGAPGPQVTCGQMQSLTALDDAGGWFIQDLEGLQHAVDLQHLELSVNYVIRLNPLAELTQLEHLNLTLNRFITDITPLAGLTKLVHLDVSGTEVDDLTVLASLSELESLSVGGTTRLSDISHLAGLTKLRRLEVSHSAIADLSPLADLTALQVLAMPSNLIDDISVLTDLAELEILVLSSNLIEDISALAGLTKLTFWLRLQDNLISDLAPLVANTALGEDIEVYLDLNCLDLSAGSPDLAAIQELTLRGVTVHASGQKPC